MYVYIFWGINCINLYNGEDSWSWISYWLSPYVTNYICVQWQQSGENYYFSDLMRFYILFALM